VESDFGKVYQSEVRVFSVKEGTMETVEVRNGEVKAAMPEIDGIPGHEGLRRAIEVALVGGHPMVVIGLDTSSASSLVRGVLDAVRDYGLPFHALATTPCPCGNYGSTKQECNCPSKAIVKHMAKVTKRRNEFDIFIESVGPRVKDMGVKPEPFAAVMARVVEARKRPEPKVDTDKSEMFKMYCREYGCDAVVVAKVKAVARSIARLEGCDEAAEHHITEAIQYSFWVCGVFRGFASAETVEVKG